ncbi:hypothetical protein COO91_01002 [Nostoc flagelliforme CCNUN1]|uniref:Uncharacterized protein n=1 Tax=Nostoc flagelliforme CCNUN1 TaxID=2038116 RepID=A0A2K8SI84_9NOSO|nr:hypothetical protein COO91_01002 [Nostoc flagelliforme CCNUN1]
MNHQLLGGSELYFVLATSQALNPVLSLSENNNQSLALRL